MSRFAQLWEMLGRPLIALACALVLGGGAVYWTWQQSVAARKGYERERAALDQVRSRLARSDEEKRLIERYAPAYQALLRAGIIGGEQRVNWIDALRTASQTTRGFGVDYQVSGQQGGGFKVDAGAYEVQQSAMKLRLPLLHEGDLLAFLDALKAQNAGLHLLRDCELQRASAGPFSARFEPKLLAECNLTWITLDDRGLKGAQ